MNIDYGHIKDALKWYVGRGYQEIDVPWLVSREALEVTRPVAARVLETPLGCLVASGEQSFIQMMMDGSLNPGNYCCITPCFRDEPVLSETHRTSFMKLELIAAWPDQEERALHEMVGAAINFHLQFLRAKIIRTFEGYDIICNDIELGSYGVREHGDLRWVYGTGVAEPRLSIATREDRAIVREMRDRIQSKEGLNVQQSESGIGEGPS